MNTSLTIDDDYVDGVSITTKTIPRPFHDSTSGPICCWYNRYGNRGCPCNNNSNIMVPDYVGSNYYCESGTNTGTICDIDFTLYLNDPLWDGLQCSSVESTCCPTDSIQPWFNTTLPQTSNDNVELRSCSSSISDTHFDFIELYIR